MNKILIICAFICLTGLASGNVLRKIRDTDKSSKSSKSSEELSEDDLVALATMAGLLVPAACARLSEDGENLKALEAGFDTFVTCVEKVVDVDDLKNKTSLDNDLDENVKEVLKEGCTVLSQLFKCVEDFSPVVDGCLKSDEIQLKDSLMRMVKNLGTYGCENDGANILAVLEDDSVDCLNSTLSKLGTCFDEPVEKYAKNPPKSSEEIDELLALSPEDCQELDKLKTCVTTNLDTCETKAPSKFVNDVYKILVSEITCGNVVN